MRHVVIGAGPAGLTAAWALARAGEQVTVLEADPTYVGGISRTVRHHGHRFDLGGHRFYSRSDEINELWRQMLPGGFIEVPRLSRIYFDGKYFPYPLEIGVTLRTMGLRRSVRVGASYLHARLRPRRPEVSFEDWVVNRFGHELYATFFRSYTEKVWGMPCTDMTKDFAAQRIRGLTLFGAVAHKLRAALGRTESKSLVEQFLYPRHGPGELWEAVRDDVVANGGTVVMGSEVVTVHRDDAGVTAVSTATGEKLAADVVYSTMTLRDAVLALDPPAPEPVRAAAHGLRFRDFLTVAVVVERPQVFPDTWIYVHDPQVRVGRIQNYRNWSAAMVGDPGVTCLGLEYFCDRGDDTWDMDDTDLADLARAELDRLGLVRPDECVDFAVVRVPDAYPVYDADYQRHRDLIRTWLAAEVPNLLPAGRGGLHNYNSQDHAMMAGLLSVRNALEGTEEHDVWAINTEQEYAETGSTAGTTRLVPTRIPRP